jgi:hypothetical protein
MTRRAVGIGHEAVVTCCWEVSTAQSPEKTPPLCNAVSNWKVIALPFVPTRTWSRLGSSGAW